MSGPIRFDVTYRRDGFELVADGELGLVATALLGPNGAGKTTLLRLLAGLERPTSGHIALGEQVLVDCARKVWVPPHARRAGVVFQEPRLWPHQRVREQIRYGGRFREDDVIAWCELEPLLQRRPSELSGGEARRVAIARALMSEPRWLLLDEPLTGLDADRRNRVLELIRRVRAELDVPLVVVSHHWSEAWELADEALLLEGGRTVAHGAFASLLGRREAADVAHRLGLDNVLKLERVDGATAYLGEQLLHLPNTERPSRTVRVRPEDILVARHRVDGLSARNQLAGTVGGCVVTTQGRALARVDVGGQTLVVELTQAAVAELGLDAGVDVIVIIKAAALRWA